jgi:hypothetical protein
MDLSYEVVSGAEQRRMRDVHQPMTQAIRDLIEASILSGVDDETVQNAQKAIEAVTASLAVDMPARRVVLRDEAGTPLPVGSPVIGIRNPVAPPLDVRHTDGRSWSEFDLGIAYEGPPGMVHGGICALIMDHLLGDAASEKLTKMMFTGTITVKYLRGTPLGPLRAEAWVESADGIKTFARGTIADAEGVTVEADGVFITPAWVREAG